MLIAFCGEVWETHRVFQGTVVRMRTRRAGHRPVDARQSACCPWSRRLSAVVGTMRWFEFSRADL